MTLFRILVFGAAFVAAQAHAQSAGEIAFWESVRDSKNPVELQAYLDQCPNGAFVALAKARLAALAPRPASPPKPAAPAVASFAPNRVTSETRMPQAGDTWVYRLSYPRIRGQWGQRARPPAVHVVKIASVDGSSIVDQISVDGGSPSLATHSRDAYLVAQGASIFSPYLVAFRGSPPTGSLGSVRILEPACGDRYLCDASARVTGQESVQVPAGKFTATKVVVSHDWRASSGGMGAAALAGMTGGRTLTIWYVPELKRAVKMQSRLTVGDYPPVDATFDLELVSCQIK